MGMEQEEGAALDGGYRVDFVVDDTFLVELKTVERLVPVHVAQVLTYLKLTGLPVALLVNFNATTLKLGLRRLTRKPQPHLPVFPTSC
jgi:GxxExxY protein